MANESGTWIMYGVDRNDPAVDPWIWVLVTENWKGTEINSLMKRSIPWNLQDYCTFY